MSSHFYSQQDCASLIPLNIGPHQFVTNNSKITNHGFRGYSILEDFPTTTQDKDNSKIRKVFQEEIRLSNTKAYHLLKMGFFLISKSTILMMPSCSTHCQLPISFPFTYQSSIPLFPFVTRLG